MRRIVRTFTQATYATRFVSKSCIAKDEAHATVFTAARFSAQNQFARSTSDSDETSAVPKNGSFSSSSLNCRIVSRGCLPNLTKHWYPTRSSPEGISFRLILHVRRFANQYTHNLSRLRAVNRRKPPNVNCGCNTRALLYTSPELDLGFYTDWSSPPYETHEERLFESAICVLRYAPFPMHSRYLRIVLTTVLNSVLRILVTRSKCPFIPFEARQ